MTNFLDSYVSASYQRCALYLYMTGSADLDPEHGEPMPHAVAVTAHEYIHYLHNMSTLAGQQYLFFNLIVLISMVHGSDRQGRFMGLAALPQEEREMVLAIRRWMDACGGAFEYSIFGGGGQVERWTFRAPQIYRVNDEVLGRFGRYETVHIPISVQRSGNRLASARVAIGYSLMTEGVAYEIDRTIRRLQGASNTSLDDGVPALPYLVFQPLVDHLVGRETSHIERIQIGVAALMHAMPGKGLISACKTVREARGTVSDALLPLINMGLAESKKIIANMQDTVERSGAAGPLVAAMTEYIELLKRGSELRQHHGLIEAAFVDGPMTVERLRSLQGQMLDCCILQKKPDGQLDHYWLGPGHIEQKVQTSGALSLLQAAFHYTHLHFRSKSTLISSSELATPVRCPYQGACQAEDKTLEPNPGVNAPWERFPNTKVGDETCWYKAGVLVFAGEEHDPTVSD